MVLVIGASGTLGKYLQLSLKAERISYDAPNSSELDITSELSISSYFEEHSCYDIMFLLAAETDVDLCEKDPRRAYIKNAVSVKYIAAAAQKIGSRIIYISSSAVFGGGVEKWRYCEIDVPNPMNLYGASKLAGENFLLSSSNDHLIVRSSWMIGGGPELDKKFISKVLPALRTNADIYAVHDKIGSLTYAKNLADYLVEAYKNNYRDIVHFASVDYTSRYDIAVYIASLLDSRSKITGVDSSFFPLSAPRASSEALYTIVNDNNRLSWQEIIKDYMKEWL